MKRLLFIAHRVPYPPNKGERVRAFHEIQSLGRHFRLTLASLSHTPSDVANAEPLRRACEKVIIAPARRKIGLSGAVLALLERKSATEVFFRSRPMRKLLAEEVEREPFDLVFAYSSSTLALALEVPARARVMDLVDVDSAKWTHYADHSSWPKSWAFRREARGVRVLEQRALKECDAVLVVSEAEARALPALEDKVFVVANGVDLDYFTPTEPARAAGPSLVFTGTMDYRPNVEAVCWFVRRVWPSLKRDLPELTFQIVGRDPARAVRQLAETDGVTVTGAVPDVRPYLSTATVVVAPLHIARGIQNKVLEAMAMGKAIVASLAALEGIEVDTPAQVLTAETPDEWHRFVRRLLQEDDFRSRLARSARGCVQAKYRWPERMSPLVSLCKRLGAGEGPFAATFRARGGASQEAPPTV